MNLDNDAFSISSFNNWSQLSDLDFPISPLVVSANMDAVHDHRNIATIHFDSINPSVPFMNSHNNTELLQSSTNDLALESAIQTTQIPSIPNKKRGGRKKKVGQKIQYQKFEKKELKELYRETIISKFENGENWRDYAISKSIPIGTARQWINDKKVMLSESEIKNYKLREGLSYSPLKVKLSKGGAYNVKIKECHLLYIKKIIEEFPTVTLRKIQELLSTKSDDNLIPINVSLSTIKYKMDGMLFTFKKLHHICNTANNDINKQKRIDYINIISNYLDDDKKKIIYIDETNVNLFTLRCFGWSKVNERAQLTRPTSQGANIQVIGGISTDGMEYHKIILGSNTKLTMAEYLRELIIKNLMKISENLDPDIYLT